MLMLMERPMGRHRDTAFVMGVAVAVSMIGGRQPMPQPAAAPAPGDRKYLLERVDDAAVVQVYADGFDALPLKDKVLLWHLYEAAIAGRDIYWDQRYAHNLEMRNVLEEILTHGRRVDPATLAEITRYTKLVWIN